MNRQSGSQLPIPVTPKTPAPMAPALPSLLDGSFPMPPRHKRRSRDRLSGLFAVAKTRTSPVWRPSTAHTPPTPQWPLPTVPITIRDENPALTKTYTQPRDAPLPPPPSSSCSDRRTSADSTTTLTNGGPTRGGFHEKSSSSASAAAATEAAAGAAAPLLHPRSPRSPASPPRPPYFPQPNSSYHQRGGSFQTRYMNMALSIDKIPRSHNILANLFAWMILAAFVMAPGNFVGPSSSSATAEKKGIPSTPLLGICATLFALGALGHTWLRWRHRRNYIWLLNRIYLPLMLHSLAGVLATLVLVDVQHGWWWSPAAYVTVSIEGATLLFSAGMFFLLDFVLLGKLKAEHSRQTSRTNVVDLVKAGKRPPFAPGSVV